ncbi:MAG: hypothetical protein JJU19_04575 [Pararhodobacter sp.]|nr:hypothetical protein [Pararhodobacter sp.]
MLRLFVAFATVLLLGATTADAWSRVATEADFLARIADRQQVLEGTGHVTWHSDGRVTGDWRGQTVRGRWQWHQGFVCRNLMIGTHETGTNCLMLELRGDQLRATQDQGRGQATITTMR